MTAAAADPRRAADIKAIHAMRRQLALAEDTYRAMVSGASDGRVESSADLTAAERGRLLDRLRKLGGGRKTAPRTRPPAGAEAQLGLLRALWLSLHALGEVKDRTDEALGAWACNQLKLDAFRWADAGELRRAIEALKGWCARVGYVPVGDGIARRVTLARLQWRLLRAAGALTVPPEADREALDRWADREQRMAGDPRRAGIEYYQPDELDRIIRALGRWLRRVKGV